MFLLVFVTPALLLVFVFRIFYPKTRTIPASETSSLLICAVFNLLVNANLIDWFTYHLLKYGGSAVLNDSYGWFAERVLLGQTEPTVCYRPFLWLAQNWGLLRPEPMAFWTLIGDLHLRSAMVALFIFLFFKGLSSLEETLQAIPYYDLNKLSLWNKFLVWRFDIPVDQTNQRKYHRERIPMSLLGIPLPMKWFREAIYHPWALLTRTNRKREILMLDVLTTEGSLYSGFFTSWVQQDQTYSEVAMEYSLRYYPRKDPAQTNQHQPSRRVVFIKNNGEMIFQRDKIETLHFWEIRKGFEVAVVIKNADDLEKVKWYLVLAYVFSGFFKSIFILVQTDAQKWNALSQELNAWILDSRVKFKKHEIKIEVVKQPVKP